MKKIPVNIVTGFLGAGKTTIILNLLQQLPNPEKVVWLKNEYGDVNIDKLLVQQTSVKVSEVLNGCLCCVLVGKLGNALKEIQEKYSPERIIIETSGTAYPASIVWEIKKDSNLYVDSVIDVVDALNFSGYKDKSYAAEVQAAYNDLIIINKYPSNLVEGSNEQLEIEHRLDDIYAVSRETPKLKTADGRVDYKLLIGLDANSMHQLIEPPHTDEHHADHQDEVETFALEFPVEKEIDQTAIKDLTDDLRQKGFIRIKGVVNTEAGAQVFNWVYARADWKPLPNYSGPTKLVFMGKKIAQFQESFRNSF